MKKSLALVLAMLMLVACLTGCGSSSSGGSTAEGGSDYPTKNVNVIVPFSRRRQHRYVHARAAERGDQP